MKTHSFSISMFRFGLETTPKHISGHAPCCNLYINEILMFSFDSKPALCRAKSASRRSYNEGRNNLRRFMKPNMLDVCLTLNFTQLVVWKQETI